jgi:hypothetical protein
MRFNKTSGAVWLAAIVLIVGGIASSAAVLSATGTALTPSEVGTPVADGGAPAPPAPWDGGAPAPPAPWAVA